MERSKKKETGFAKFSRKVFILSFIAFVVGFVALNSYEASLNIDCEKLQQEIATIESEIDGLDMQKQELASFTRIESIAKEKGYTYRQNTVTAAVVGVQRD